ncbi:MAG: 50S ribosomal protein L9 [Candidatus Margulisiibacteriota bacterium]|jgi:large subunit ribosomal protein L9
MKIIYLEDDRVENVADGYARNYLFPKKLAVLATKSSLVQVEKRKEKKQAIVEKKKAELMAIAEKLGQLELTIPMEAGEGGKLFGSVTTLDVVKEIKSSSGIEIDKRKVTIRAPIKFLGEYSVLVTLYQSIKADVKLKITVK